MSTPVRDRPDIPASYGTSGEDEGLLSWEEVSQSFGVAATYWVSMTRGDAGPHLIPIWGGWANEHLHIEGGDDTLWHRALTREPRTHVGADHEGMQIILSGVATIGPVEPWEPVAENFAAKYPYQPDPKDMWRISPAFLMAWRTDTMDAFGVTPTRSTFEEV